MTVKNIVLVQAFLTAFTIHLLLFSYSPMVQLVVEEMGVSHAGAGFIFSVCILTIMLLRIPWGFVIDRFGFMTTAKVAMVLVGVFSFLRGFSTGYHDLLIFQLFLGAGVAALLPCLAKIVNVMFREKVGLATGVYVSGFPIGDLAGLGLTSHLLSTFNNDWRAVFKMFGLWALALTLLWWLVDRLLPEERRNQSQPMLEFKKLLRSKQMWLLTGLCICSMGCYDTLLTFLPCLLEIRGMGAVEAGVTSSMLPVGFLISGLSVGAVSDKAGSRKPFIWILGLAAIPSTLLISYTSGELLWTTMLAAGFTLSGILTLILIVAAEHPEIQGFVGGAVALISSIGNVGSFLFPILVGLILDITGSPAPPLLALAVIAGATLMLNTAVEETGKAKVKNDG
ncbi:MAG: MFS transporter [Candidatus Bathyarchaeia archaeon]